MSGLCQEELPSPQPLGSAAPRHTSGQPLAQGSVGFAWALIPARISGTAPCCHQCPAVSPWVCVKPARGKGAFSGLCIPQARSGVSIPCPPPGMVGISATHPPPPSLPDLQRFVSSLFPSAPGSHWLRKAIILECACYSHEAFFTKEKAQIPGFTGL